MYRETLSYYRLLTESISDWIWEVDANGVYTYSSSRVTDLLGYSPEEMIGRTPFDFMPEAEAERIRAIFKEIVLEKKPIVRLENTNLHKDGHEIVLETSGVPIFDAKQMLTGYRGVDRDISERVRRDKEYRKLYQAVEQSPSIVMITDTDGIIEYVNPKFTQITGYSAEEVMGKDPGFFKSGKTSGEEFHILWETIKNGDEWQGEFLNSRKDSSLFWESASISPIRNKTGEVTHYIKVAEDITRRKELEDKIALNQQQLYQASKMAAIGTLVAGVAHEINNPNQIILGNIGLVKEMWDDILPIVDEHFHEKGDFKVAGITYSRMRKQITQIIEKISNGSERIKHIVKELRDFAVQSPIGVTEIIDINDVVNSSISLLSNLIKRSTDYFKLQLQPDIPKIRGNFQRLEQVVINLLVNACQALPDRSKSVEITSGINAASKAVILKIIDSGKGIPQEILDKIVDPFFTTKRSEGGTGLGLSISSSIINEHNGLLKIDSSFGKGTTVTVQLPIYLSERQSKAD